MRKRSRGLARGSKSWDEEWEAGRTALGLSRERVPRLHSVQLRTWMVLYEYSSP